MELQFLRGSVGNREQYCYPWLVISAPCRSEPYRAGARGFRGFRVFTYFPPSSFLRSSYLLDSSTNISTCLSTLVSSYTKTISSSYVDYYWLQCPDTYPKSTSGIPSSAPPLPPEGTMACLYREYCRILISVSVIMLPREFVRPLTRAICAGAISCPSLCCRHSLEGSCLWLRCPRTGHRSTPVAPF